MKERLQKIISAAGIMSRRAAEDLIVEGRVRVNGTVVTELGSKADPEKDHIKVDGKLINPRQARTYVVLNKPVGYVTTLSDPEGRPIVQDLLGGLRVRVYPVGRLDYNTEGLLLLTNDGEFAHLITHPSHELPKTYLAKIKGELNDRAVGELERGIFMKDGRTAPAKVKRLRKEEKNSWVEITIHEGRKRQVRRMFDHMGHSVIRLKRVRVGSLNLGNLQPGTYRHLRPEEVNALRELAQGRQPVKVQEGKPGKKRAPETRGPRPELARQGQRPKGRSTGPMRRGTETRAEKPGPARPDQGHRGRGPAFNRQGPGISDRRPGFKRQGPGSADRRPAFNRPGPGASDRRPGFKRQGPGSADRRPAFNRPGPGASDRRPGFKRQGPGSADRRPAFNRPGPGTSDRRLGFKRQGPGASERRPEFKRQGPGSSGRSSGFKRQAPGVRGKGSGAKEPVKVKKRSTRPPVSAMWQRPEDDVRRPRKPRE